MGPFSTHIPAWSTNDSGRRVRNRMLGGVGAGRGNPPGYPIWATPLPWTITAANPVPSITEFLYIVLLSP